MTCFYPSLAHITPCKTAYLRPVLQLLPPCTVCNVNQLVIKQDNRALITEICTITVACQIQKREIKPAQNDSASSDDDDIYSKSMLLFEQFLTLELKSNVIFSDS